MVIIPESLISVECAAEPATQVNLCFTVAANGEEATRGSFEKLTSIFKSERKEWKILFDTSAVRVCVCEYVSALLGFTVFIMCVLYIGQ